MGPPLEASVCCSSCGMTLFEICWLCGPCRFILAMPTLTILPFDAGDLDLDVAEVAGQRLVAADDGLGALDVGVAGGEAGGGRRLRAAAGDAVRLEADHGGQAGGGGGDDDG